MPIDEETRRAAQGCWDFYWELCNVGFSKDQAILIVSAWYGRPPGMDAATMNAIGKNFAETLRGENAS